MTMTAETLTPAGHSLSISAGDERQPRRSGSDRLRIPRPGRADDPRWIRPAPARPAVLTAVLYLWGLGASGWANSFYSAAVQAGTNSWKAFFFGSSDASNFITVDKPPAALWLMELSARVFGVNSWSILVPQALEGVGRRSALLYAARSTQRLGRRRPGCSPARCWRSPRSPR